MGNNTLVSKMVKLANDRKLAADDSLRIAAKKLDDAIASGNVKKIVGSWVKARSIWRDYTGESLV